MKLFVDDTRPCPAGWVLARTYKEAMAHLFYCSNGVSEVSLDHDLGEEKTGYDIACAIEEVAHTFDNYNPPLIHCHSANPVGIKRIETVAKKVNQWHKQ